MSDLILNYAEMLEDDFICPLCGHDFKCTQCGPNNKPKLSWLLQKLPSATMFKKFCRIHDISYNIAPVKAFRIIGIPNIGSWYIHEKDKVSCDILFYNLMLNYVKSMKWYSRFLYKQVAKAYYESVRSFGDSSFIHNHNKGI